MPTHQRVAARARQFFLDDPAADVEQMAVPDADGRAGRLTQARQVRQRSRVSAFFADRPALQDPADQVDAPARAVDSSPSSW